MIGFTGWGDKVAFRCDGFSAGALSGEDENEDEADFKLDEVKESLESSRPSTSCKLTRWHHVSWLGDIM